MRRRLCRTCGLLYDGPRCSICASRQRDPQPSATVNGSRPRPAPDPEIEDIVKRLHSHLASIPTRYPRVWQQVDEFRAARGKELEDWPAWCFLPMAGAYAIATSGRDDVTPGTEVAVISALAAWRVSKGIYRFDATVFDELWNTPVTGEIPVEVLERLPEWCCYIPFPEQRKLLPGGTADGAMPPCLGFFVHLESDVNTGRRELRFLLDYRALDAESSGWLSGIPMHLAGNLPDCVDAAIAEMERNFRKTIRGEDMPRVLGSLELLREHMAGAISPLVSLTLYLCSTSAEIVPRGGYRPKLRHAKRESKLFAAQEPVVWEVAYRIGATLRAAKEQATSRDKGGSHASPRPHIRRAHWHSFWTGEKAKTVGQQTKRELVLRWLPPIAVKCDPGGETIPVVHRVMR